MDTGMEKASISQLPVLVLQRWGRTENYFHFSGDGWEINLPFSCEWALFLIECHLVSLLASAIKETNRVSYQKLPAQRNKGSESWGTISVLGFLWGCSSTCVECCYSSRCAWIWPVDKSSNSEAAQQAPLISTAVCIVFWTERELNWKCL